MPECIGNEFLNTSLASRTARKRRKSTLQNENIVFVPKNRKPKRMFSSTVIHEGISHPKFPVSETREPDQEFTSFSGFLSWEFCLH